MNKSVVRHSRFAFRRRGFTLLELVLVLVIISTVIAMAAPNLRGWRKGAALRSSMEELLSLTRLARSEAVSKGKIHRIEFDESMKFQLKVQQGYVSGQVTADQIDSAGFVPVTGEWSKIYSLPEGARIEVNKAQVLNATQESSARVLDFYPNGRTQAATITVTDSDNYQVTLQCKTPAGNYKWMSEGGKQ